VQVDSELGQFGGAKRHDNLSASIALLIFSLQWSDSAPHVERRQTLLPVVREFRIMMQRSYCADCQTDRRHELTDPSMMEPDDAANEKPSRRL